MVDALLWVAIVVGSLLVLWVLVSVVWALVMITLVARGAFGDPVDLGGDDGTVRSEP